MSRYRRGKGFKPTYDKFATAHYVSRKARNLHGARLAPAAKTLRPGGGWYFWFPSPRASAALRGNHRVEAIINDGGAGGGGPTPPEIVAPVTFSRWFLVWTWAYDFTDSWTTPSKPLWAPSRLGEGSGSFTNFLSEFPGSTVLYTYPASAGYYTNQVGSPDGGLRTYTDNSYGLGFVIVTGGHRIVLRSSQLGGPLTLQYFFDEFDGSDLVASHVQGSFAWSYEDWRFHGPLSYNFRITGFWLLPIDEIGPPYYGDAPSGDLPDGFLTTPGPYAYRCSCQDFTFAEQPYAAPAFASQRQARSWNQTRPLSPCKHIVSAARALADMKAFNSWWVAGQKDVFPKSYPRKEPVSPGQAFLDRLRRQAQRTYGRPRRARRRRWNPWSWQVEARELAQREWNAPDRSQVSGAIKDYMNTRSQVAEDTYRRTYENEVAAGSPHRQAEQVALDRTRETLHEIPAYDIRNPVDRARFRERESARYPDRNIAEQAQAVPPE